MANPNTTIAVGQRENLALALGNGINMTSVQWTYTDLVNAFTGVASGTAATSNLFIAPNTPPFNVAGPTLGFGRGSVVLYLRVKHYASFTGGSLTGMTVSIGKVGGATNYFGSASLNVFQAPNDYTLLEVTGISMGQIGSVTPTITFTPVGDTVANCTAGGLAVDIIWAQVTTPSQYIANQVVVNSSPL